MTSGNRWSVERGECWGKLLNPEEWTVALPADESIGDPVGGTSAAVAGSGAPCFEVPPYGCASA